MAVTMATAASPVYCGSGALGASIHAGFLTDSLSVHEDKDGQSKYLGVCKLPGEGRKVGNVHQ